MSRSPHGRDRGPDLVAVGDIVRMRVGFATCGSDQVEGLQEALLVEIGAVDAGAGLRQQDGGGTADSMRRRR